MDFISMYDVKDDNMMAAEPANRENFCLFQQEVQKKVKSSSWFTLAMYVVAVAAVFGSFLDDSLVYHPIDH